MSDSKAFKACGCRVDGNHGVDSSNCKQHSLRAMLKRCKQEADSVKREVGQVADTESVDLDAIESSMLTDFPPNWDSYGAPSPDPQAIKRAMAVMRAMQAGDVSVCPTALGTVLIAIGDCHIEVYADKSASYIVGDIA